MSCARIIRFLKVNSWMLVFCARSPNLQIWGNLESKLVVSSKMAMGWFFNVQNIRELGWICFDVINNSYFCVGSLNAFEVILKFQLWIFSTRRFCTKSTKVQSTILLNVIIIFLFHFLWPFPQIARQICPKKNPSI